MEATDLLVTPVLFLVVLLVAWFIRPWVTYEENRQYFIPALVVRVVGALALGALYQFYYGGGDTFNYFTHGGKQIYEAFLDEPAIAFKLIFADTNYPEGVYKYAARIWMYRDPPAYMVVRIAGIFAILTGGTYSGTALLFALVSFSGLWAMYMAFCKLFPQHINRLALAILFIPSTVFWGSGILKDSITFGMLGWSTAALIHLLYWRKHPVRWLVILVLSLLLIAKIKVYIVLSFIPAAMVWLYKLSLKKIPNQMARLLAAPLIILLVMGFGALTVYQISKSSPRYALDRLAETARITAYDIGRWTGRSAGSRYDLGDFDGTLPSMLRLAPAAINVSLFRPYLWEVRNPLMLLAALESFVLTIITLIIVVRMIRYRIRVLRSPAAWFALTFVLVFAFAVGISTYNFGSLFRYKVPLMPFFAILLTLAWGSASRQISHIRQQKQNERLSNRALAP